MRKAREPSMLELALAHNRGESLYRDFSQPPVFYDSATGLSRSGRGPVTWIQGTDGPVQAGGSAPEPGVL